MTLTLEPPADPPVEPPAPTVRPARLIVRLARLIVRLARSIGSALRPVVALPWFVIRAVAKNPDPKRYWLTKLSLLMTVALGFGLWCLCAVSGWFFLAYVLVGAVAYLGLHWRRQTRTLNIVLWAPFMLAKALYFGAFWALYGLCVAFEIWNFQTDYWTPLDAVRNWPL